jgi:hypothetical protein
MDLDSAAEVLYAGSPDDFIERRTALVAQARAAKDRALAKQIGALRRPTRTAWLINLLARRAAEEVSRLLALGSDLQDAQRRMAGAELRQLSEERRHLVDRLARQAVRLGAEQGYTAPDSAVQEVSQSLQAALGDPAVAEQLRSGRFTAAASYGGFGPSDLMAAMAASLPAGHGSSTPDAQSASDPGAAAEPPPDAGAERVQEPDDDRATAEERRRRAARVAEAEAAWEAARAALDEAESAANQATAHADELADRIEELRVELRRTEAEETAAREAARAARRAHQEARRVATAAQHAREAALSEQAEGG